MPLTTTRDLLQHAGQRRGAVAAINVIGLEFAEAAVEGAAAAGRPLILQVSENAVAYHAGTLEPLASSLVALAEASESPVALHLDHVIDDALLRRAAGCGFSSVMVDAGALPYEENITKTAAAADWGRREGLLVEAELGYVGGKPTQVQSAHAPGVRTDPVEAAEFVERTGVDALAVAVGNSHAMVTATAALDHGLIARLCGAVPVPLVLHGSSGVATDALRQAVEAGMRKINVGTAFSSAFRDALASSLVESPQRDVRHALAAGRSAAQRWVEHFLEDETFPPIADS